MIGDNQGLDPGSYPPYREELDLPRPDYTERYARPAEDRTLGDLFTDLTRDFRTLVRQEIDLAKTESTEKAKKAGKHVAFIGAGGFVAYAGFIAIVFAVAYLLGEVMPLWLSTLLVGAAVTLAGYMLIQSGLKGLKHTDFSLKRTAETLKEDKQWLKEEMK